MLYSLHVLSNVLYFVEKVKHMQYSKSKCFKFIFILEEQDYYNLKYFEVEVEHLKI